MTDAAAAVAAVDITIVGLGSRGLSVLERIVTLAGRPARPYGAPLTVAVIDPAGTGCGVHGHDLPDHLLLNTPCAQVSMFPDQGTVDAGTARRGPNLHEWFRARGGTAEPGDYLPRRVLGEYLDWFRGHLMRVAGDAVRTRMHRTSAVDLNDTCDGRRAVACADGTVVVASQVFLTVGYTSNRGQEGDHPQAGRRIDVPYPMPGRLADIDAGAVVAVSGFGLSAMDVIACLTVGRGGRFTGTGADLTYRPAGTEPTVVLFSRSGAPYRVRPRAALTEPADPAVVLTTSLVDELRRDRPGGRLDLHTDLLPLVRTEMRVAHRRAAARRAGDREVPAALERLRGLPPSQRHAAAETLLASIDRVEGPFDVDVALANTAGMAVGDAVAYQDWLIDTVHRDLAESALPLRTSPVKAALEVVEDHRDAIRHAVDFGGLTGESCHTFLSTVVPMINRAVVGPQWERHAELLALFDAGVVAAPLGPAPAVAWSPEREKWRLTGRALDDEVAVDADWLVAGHVSLPSVDASTSPLVAGLHARGRIRPYQPVPGHSWGIDIDRDQHPLDTSGEPDPRIWVLGTLCEGRTYYTNLVPFPAEFCRPVHDAHRCAAAALARLGRCRDNVPAGHSVTA